MSTSLARRFTLLLVSLAMSVAFVATTASARAEGPHGAGVASILAAESSAGAPIRPRAAKPAAATPVKHHVSASKAKPNHHASKARKRP